MLRWAQYVTSTGSGAYLADSHLHIDAARGDAFSSLVRARR
jgi:hypothetical protein